MVNEDKKNKDFTITKKIAKHGKQAIIVIPRILEDKLKPGTIAEIKINIIEGEDWDERWERFRRTIKSIFEKFPVLEEKQNDYAFTLSGGQQQLLAIARALIQSPKILLLDEPSLGLSPKAMKEIFKKIQEINKQGVTIIIVEQNAKQAVDIAHRTYILENGEIALEGGKEILKDKRIKDIYFGGV